MNTPSIFQRGQVWQYVDPIYGNKSRGIEVPIGEATLRYCRHVIIMGITPDVIVVVPCSHRDHGDWDLPFETAFVYTNSVSYARVDRIMPVNPKTLTKYICTLSDNVIDNISKMLLSLLIPTLNGKPFQDLVEVDLNVEKKRIEANSRNVDLSLSIREFIKTRIARTTDKTASISNKALKTEFDRWARSEKKVGTNDLVKFMDIFAYIINSMYGDDPQCPNIWWNTVRITGLKFRTTHTQSSVSPDPVPEESPASTETVIRMSSNKPKRKWSEENIQTFLMDCDTMSAEKVGEKYKLSKDTVSKYWKMWEPKFNINQSNEPTDNSEEISEKELKDSVAALSKTICGFMLTTIIQKQIRLTNKIAYADLKTQIINAICTAICTVLGFCEKDEGVLCTPYTLSKCKWEIPTSLPVSDPNYRLFDLLKFNVRNPNPYWVPLKESYIKHTNCPVDPERHYRLNEKLLSDNLLREIINELDLRVELNSLSKSMLADRFLLMT